MAPSLPVASTSSVRTRRLLAATAIFGSIALGSRLLAKRLLLLLLYHPSKDPSLLQKLRHYGSIFERYLYRLQMIDYELPAKGPAKLEQKAILVHPEEAPTALWVVFGGNAMMATDWFDIVEKLLQSQREGMRPAFLLFDYPGYGGNSGCPSPSSILAGSVAAITAALPALASQPAQLHILGHSLGAAAASQLASAWSSQTREQHGLDAGCLVLSAPFTHIAGMAQIIARQICPIVPPPLWLLRLLIAHHWDNHIWIPKAAASGWTVRIMHGSHDEIVPFFMGKSLQTYVERAGHTCEFVAVKGGDHNSLLWNAFGDLLRLMEPPPRTHPSLL